MLLLLGGVASTDVTRCACAPGPEIGRWCEMHERGYVGPFEITSKRLYETLDAHGHDLKLDSFTCPTCRQAIESDGLCEAHKIGFVSGQAYFSVLTFHLAKGERREPSDLECPVCRENAESHGWCEACGVGMVGHTAIADEADYARVLRAIEVLHMAIDAAERCEDCALAIITDTRCPVCRILYKDGKPLEPAEPAER